MNTTHQKNVNNNKTAIVQNFNSKKSTMKEQDPLIAFNCAKFDDVVIEQNAQGNTKNNGFEFQLITPKDILKSQDKLNVKAERKNLIEYSPNPPSEKSSSSPYD